MKNLQSILKLNFSFNRAKSLGIIFSAVIGIILALVVSNGIYQEKQRVNLSKIESLHLRATDAAEAFDTESENLTPEAYSEVANSYKNKLAVIRQELEDIEPTSTERDLYTNLALYIEFLATSPDKYYKPLLNIKEKINEKNAVVNIKSTLEILAEYNTELDIHEKVYYAEYYLIS